MNKHTITIDANDIPRGEDLATKIMEEVFEMKIDLSDLDVLFNKIKDMGNGICIIIKNAGKLTKDARKALEDTLARSTGLEVVLDYGGGRTERHASAPAPKVDINIVSSSVNVDIPKQRSCWDKAVSCLIKIFLVLLALGLLCVAWF